MRISKTVHCRMDSSKKFWRPGKSVGHLFTAAGQLKMVLSSSVRIAVHCRIRQLENRGSR